MKNLLRPQQIADFEIEEKSLLNSLKNRDSDKAAINGQLRRLKTMLDTQTPKAVTGKDEDALIKENKALLDKILPGMCSQEEMRKCPPGAVDKHVQWERQNKERIMRWKNNMLRLHAGDDSSEIANLEKHRPVTSSLSMDNALISGKAVHIPPNVAIGNLMSDEDRESLAETRSRLVAQAIKENDKELAKFLSIDLDELKAEAKPKSKAKEVKGIL